MLVNIQQSIERRVAATLSDHPEWPCRAGCDHCCRHLAAPLVITEPEWRLLFEGFKALPQHVQVRIAGSIGDLETQSRPFTCPFLDGESGICMTYEQRPLACRTYGFYVQRHEGLYCERIQEQADSGKLDNVVWGNNERVQEGSACLGATRSVTEWFKREANGG